MTVYINYEDDFNYSEDAVRSCDVFVDGGKSEFQVKNFEIVTESRTTDCEDHNDIARWLLRGLLAIKRKEHGDTNFHCDWSAESNGWVFDPVIRKKD